MYSNQENVNILTALLVEHHVEYAVVCPGSRNAPIVHNLNECPQIRCFPVTDERSAGFFACGLSLSYGKPRPVAVCVTSGTALLNLLPAVAEAFYQHIPLVVVSADRPPQWIGQQDGQTLPQPDALGRFVRRAVSLPAVPVLNEHASGEMQRQAGESRWYCNRLVNEALIAAAHPFPQPVHINVPIAEPLFRFDVASLPAERMVQAYHSGQVDKGMEEELCRILREARRPMMVIGQCHLPLSSVSGDGQSADMAASDVWPDSLKRKMVVLAEPLGSFGTEARHFDEVLLAMGNDERLQPDVVVSLGGHIVSKRLKRFLRAAPCRVYELSADATMHDTFMHIRGLFVGDVGAMVRAMDALPDRTGDVFYRRWQQCLERAALLARSFRPGFSQMAAVKMLEERLSQRGDCRVVYGNSSPVRLANIYALHHVWCNRGVNGIEGTLSTAAGMAAAVNGNLTLCVLGDLSFFYDQNALWNTNIGPNLRILLLNNGQGGIFRRLKGLEQSPARDRFVAGQHHTTAEGICQQNRVDYLSVASIDGLEGAIDWLMADGVPRPRLVEVLTDGATDERVMNEYDANFQAFDLT